MSRILTILVILALSGQVAAHGANSYAIIVRSESVMPESADLIVNDTEAPVAINRTLSTNNDDFNTSIWSLAGYDSPPTVEQMVRETPLD